jgi:hypothetical protein
MSLYLYTISIRFVRNVIGHFNFELRRVKLCLLRMNFQLRKVRIRYLHTVFCCNSAVQTNAYYFTNKCQSCGQVFEQYVLK